MIQPHWEQESSLNSEHILQMLCLFKISRSLHFCRPDVSASVFTDEIKSLSFCLTMEALHGNIGVSSKSSLTLMIVSQFVHLKTPLSIGKKLQNIKAIHLE